MSRRGSCVRAAASGVGLTLALGLLPAPAQSQGVLPGQAPSLPEAPAPRRSPGAWVKLCDRGSSGDAAGETCKTLTEQIHPNTGRVLLAVTFEQAKLAGGERNVLTVTVPKGVARERGAALTVFPSDLWQKLQRQQRLDGADETRLKVRTFKLAYRQCGKTACTAEAEVTPMLLEQLKSNAGLLVHTVRSPGTPVSQPLSLVGFSEALAGPATDSRRFNEARERLLREIAARQKSQR